MSDGLLSIGEVADAVDIKVSAVRYYDEVGLIASEARVGGKRRFRRDVINRVAFVLRAQAVGFSLDEIGELLDDKAGGWRELVDAKVAELTNQRDDLDAMIATLNDSRTCGCNVVASCERITAS